ncbi:hypothetical protein KM043_009656 [Ampulex compressa]|nr:hypothetical protein KM043_009656 [Ampulex compressa]
MRPSLDIMIIIFFVGARSEPCTEYGCPGRPHYEPFVPAPPGHTPSCAKPGQTFCETPDHYPRQLIKFLVDKCSFDFNSILKDESNEDFYTYRSPPEYPEGYHYTKHPITLPHYPVGGVPSMVYGLPTNDSQQNGNPFIPGLPVTKYHRNNQRHLDRPSYAQPQSLNSFGQGQPWWANRNTRSSKVAPRSVYENPLLSYTKSKRERTRRQSNPDTIALCPTEPQYITPRAALNNQGNWMYVVNLQDQTKYSQVVRSERCSNDVCNGICSVPAGYTSKCQQQYVQKRLVALEGSGNRLYTDVFWFPHGCSCQIMLNYSN